MAKVIGMEHIGIVSKDTKGLMEWYKKMFGGDVVYVNEKSGTYFLRFENGDMIEFVSAKSDKPEDEEKSAGIRHIALAVDSETFDELVPALKAEGCETVHDASENAKGLKTYWFKDIEGNFMHLIYRPQPLEPVEY